MDIVRKKTFRVRKKHYGRLVTFVKKVLLVYQNEVLSLPQLINSVCQVLPRRVISVCFVFTAERAAAAKAALQLSGTARARLQLACCHL